MCRIYCFIGAFFTSETETERLTVGRRTLPLFFLPYCISTCISLLIGTSVSLAEGPFKYIDEGQGDTQAGCQWLEVRGLT
jgi:hypothetical protein